MLKLGKLATLAVLSALAINPVFAKDKSAATVNGVSIPQARVDLRVKIATSQGQADNPELRKAIRDDMINLELLVQAAKKIGLNKDPEVIQQTQLAHLSILGGAYVQDYAKKHPVGDDQLAKEYDKLKANLGENEYQVRHIQVETEDEAKSIISQLEMDGNFDEIAKQKSKDAGSADKGGSLGWAVPGYLPPSFASAMIKLKKGEYTKDPVQSAAGWHVIQLDDTRNLKMPALEELKPQMQQQLQQQIIKDLIAELRSKAKIE